MSSTPLAVGNSALVYYAHSHQDLYTGLLSLYIKKYFHKLDHLFSILQLLQTYNSYLILSSTSMTRLTVPDSQQLNIMEKEILKAEIEKTPW